MSKKKHLTSRARKKRQKNRIGTVMLLGMLVVALLVGWQYLTFKPTVLDPETGCPQDVIESLTVVMIDGSDRISPRQQAFVRNHLDAIKEGIEVGGMIQVFALGTDGENLLTPLVFACNPGRPSDVNPFTGSQRRAQKLWEEAFVNRLDPAFDQLLASTETDLSPIFESIQSVGIEAFQKAEWKEKPRKLVIVSDMIQYMPEFSHYAGAGNFDAFSQTSYFRRVRTDLSGVDVTIYYLPRETQNRIQGPDHLNFWKDYFLDQGARPGDPAFFIQVEG